jgi:hypothetical protein
MRYAFLAIAAAATISGAALANDYIVVKSDDPGIPVSASFDAGQRVPLARSASLTLMSASGEVGRDPVQELLRLRALARGESAPAEDEAGHRNDV